MRTVALSGHTRGGACRAHHPVCTVTVLSPTPGGLAPGGAGLCSRSWVSSRRGPGGLGPSHPACVCRGAEEAAGTGRGLCGAGGAVVPEWPFLGVRPWDLVGTTVTVYLSPCSPGSPTESPHPRTWLCHTRIASSFWADILGSARSYAMGSFRAAELWDDWNRVGVTAVQRGCLAAVVWARRSAWRGARAAAPGRAWRDQRRPAWALSSCPEQGGPEWRAPLAPRTLRGRDRRTRVGAGPWLGS